MKHKYVWVIVLGIFISVVCSECLESSFRLSDDSRIPYFFQEPKGTNRKDLYVTLDYYSTFSGGESIFKLYRKDKFFKLDEVVVEQNQADHMLKLKNPPPGYPERYPSYEIVRTRGVEDVIEQKRMEPIFYTTDDPEIWKEFGLTQ